MDGEVQGEARDKRERVAQGGTDSGICGCGRCLLGLGFASLDCLQVQIVLLSCWRLATIFIFFPCLCSLALAQENEIIRALSVNKFQTLRSVQSKA